MELATGIHCIGGRKGGRVRAFLIEDGPDLTVIDTLYERDARLVLDGIQRLGRSPSDLKRIVITHAHRSHLGGLVKLKQLTGAAVLAHEWEAGIVAGERKQLRPSIVPRLPVRAYLPFQLGAAVGLGNSPPCPVDDTLTDDAEIAGLQVLHTPGHTPGHLSFYSPARGVLIAGDAIATWPRFEAGWPGFTLDEERHRASIARMATLEAKVVAVGHGDPITGQAAERVQSLVDH